MRLPMSIAVIIRPSKASVSVLHVLRSHQRAPLMILTVSLHNHHHHHLPYSTGHFFSVLRTGLYASSPEPHECHGNGNGQANIECYISLPLAPSSSPLPPYAFPSPLISPPPHPHEPLKRGYGSPPPPPFMIRYE